MRQSEVRNMGYNVMCTSHPKLYELYLVSDYCFAVYFLLGAWYTYGLSQEKSESDAHSRSVVNGIRRLIERHEQ